MHIARLDHLVLTVANLETTIAFYAGVLGMELVRFDNGRTALNFGQSKINLHEAGHSFTPYAEHPTPGSADVCLILEGELEDAIADLERAGVPIEEGPVERTGATGVIRSVYVRDPDRNLIELSTYPPT